MKCSILINQFKQRTDVCVASLVGGDLSAMMSVVAKSAHANERAVHLLSQLGKGLFFL
jgi:hypothetical protein